MDPRFGFRATPLDGLVEVTRLPRRDARGLFERMFDAADLEAAGWPGPVRQVNRSVTAGAGMVRGLHYQVSPHAEAKLVTCTRGRVFDVAVDLRAGSPTLLRWHGVVLDTESSLGLLIPAGFAHGFQTLGDDCEMLYVHSRDYAPGADAGLHPLETRVAVAWPAPVGQMSPRDAAFAALDADFRGLAP